MNNVLPIAMFLIFAVVGSTLLKTRSMQQRFLDVYRKTHNPSNPLSSEELQKSVNQRQVSRFEATRMFAGIVPFRLRLYLTHYPNNSELDRLASTIRRQLTISILVFAFGCTLLLLISYRLSH